MCLHVLRANFKGSKPVHVLIAGAVACLKYLLFDYHLLLAPPVAAVGAAKKKKKGKVDKLRELDAKGAHADIKGTGFIGFARFLPGFMHWMDADLDDI